MGAVRIVWILLVAIPVAVLIGWVIQNPYLKSVVPGFSPMSPVSMTCFMLIALAIVATARRWKRAPTINAIAGCIAIVVGATILFRTMSGFDIPIDQILFHDRLNGNHVAPNTALNFVLVGLVLCLYAYRSHLKSLSLALIGVNAFISLLSIIGYAFGLKELFGITGFNPMAIHTAVCFLLVDILIATAYLGFNRMYLNMRVIASLVVVIALPILATIIAEGSMRQADLLQTQTVRTEAILRSAEKLRIAHTDAETAQRGYLLTGRSVYLEPYQRAAEQVDFELANLRKLTEGDTIGESRTYRLNQVSRQKLDELLQTIELRQRGNSAAALAIVNSDTGKQYMDTIRSELTDLETYRTAELSETRSEATASRQRAQWYLALSIAVDILLLLIAFFQMQRTARLQAESYAALNAERLKLKTLLESIGDGVFVIDSDRRITLFNTAAEAISGITAKQALGKRYDDVLEFTYESSGELNHDFIDIALRGKAAKMANHTQLKHHSGRQIPVADSAAPYWSHDKNSVAGVIVVFRDVTQERKLDQAKDDFVSLASHQLRTPATAVKQFLGLILDGYAGDTKKLSKEQNEYIRLAFESNDEQIELVNSLLEIARIEAGTVDFQPKDTDLGKLVQKTVDRQKVLVRSKQQELVFTLPEPPLSASVDANLITTCLDNLINNASKYTPEKSRIEVVIEDSGKQITIAVRDNGDGISKQGLAQLFKRFSRLDHSTNGTGLGLFLVKLVCELHGGKVDVESHVGKGSVFSIILPKGGDHAQKDSDS